MDPISTTTSVIGIIQLALNNIRECAHTLSITRSPKELEYEYEALERDLRALLDGLTQIYKRSRTPQIKVLEKVEDEASGLQSRAHDLSIRLTKHRKRGVTSLNRVWRRNRSSATNPEFETASSCFAAIESLLHLIQYQNNALAHQLAEYRYGYSIDDLLSAEPLVRPLMKSIKLYPEGSLEFLSSRSNICRHAKYQSYRLLDSCEWFLRLPQFEKWQNSEHPQWLWCEGDRGIGKSVLMSKVVDHLKKVKADDDSAELKKVKEGDDSANRNYAFFYMGHGKVQDGRDLLASVLQQLCDAHDYRPKPLKVMAAHFEMQQSINRGESPPFSELEKCFLELVDEQNLKGRVRILIDAFDKSNMSDVDSFKDALNVFSSTGCALMVFSRNGPYDSLFDAKWDYFNVEPANNVWDMKMHIQSKLKESDSVNGLIQKYPELPKEIETRIINVAEGRLYRCTLQTEQILQQKTPRDLLNAVRTLQEKKMIHSALKSLSNQDEDSAKLARRTLIWLSVSVEPIDVRALCEALTVVHPPYDVNPYDNRTLSSEDVLSPELIKSICKNFIWENDGSKTFELANVDIELTIREYWSKELLRERAKRARACIKYLLLDDFSGGPCDTVDAIDRRFWKRPFAQYAARYWFRDYVEARDPELDGDEEQKTALEKLALILIRSPSHLASAVQILLWTEQPKGADKTIFKKICDQSQKTSSLQLAAKAGLLDLLKGDIVRDDAVIDDVLRAEQLFDILMDGLFRSSEDANKPATKLDLSGPVVSRLGRNLIVELLVCDRDIIARRGADLLDRAIDHEDTAIVRKFLNEEIRFVVQDDGRLFLTRAIQAKQPNLEIIKDLLAAGALEPGEGQTPLQAAASIGNAEIVELLIQHGASIGTPKGSTIDPPLFVAIKEHHQEVVRVLLQNGANTGLDPILGTTPLHLAVQEGNTAIIRLLLAESMNIHLPDREGNQAKDLPNAKKDDIMRLFKKFDFDDF